MRAGDVLLLENVRRNEGEKANDSAFGSALASFGSLYVNDAFSASHRSHASIVGVPKHIPAYAGFLFAEEVEHLSAALSPQKPSLAILGGAKFDTKEPLIKKLLGAYDTLFLAGALVNDVLKAKGLEVGRSLVSEKGPDPSVLAHPHLLLPVDVLVERPDGQARVRKVHEVQKDEKIVDIGPVSFGLLLPYIQQAQFILWNGPTGLYEGGYDDWTSAIAEAVAETKAQSIAGVVWRVLAILGFVVVLCALQAVVVL
jgi:phosphoglycerate kinase